MEDTNKTFSINHSIISNTLSSDKRIEINKDICLTLLQIVSPRKIDSLRPGTKEKLDSDLQTFKDFTKLTHPAIQDKLCLTCSELFSKELSCGCFLCSHLSQPIISALSSIINKQSQESLRELKSLKCPKCDSELQEKDLEKLSNEFKLKRDEIRLSMLAQSLNFNSLFMCGTCNTLRGAQLFPSTSILPCGHMCKFCISKQYLTNKKKKCAECNENINVEVLAYEQFNCTVCSSLVYFMGDRMMESSPNTLACCVCLSTMVTQGYCNSTNRTFTTIEKKEILQYIYAQCEICGNDIYWNEAKKIRCCNVYLCSDCVASNNYCPKCGTAIDR